MCFFHFDRKRISIRKNCSNWFLEKSWGIYHYWVSPFFLFSYKAYIIRKVFFYSCISCVWSYKADSIIKVYSFLFQNLVVAYANELEAAAGCSRRRGACRGNLRGSNSNVSARQREGGSLPSNVNHVQVILSLPLWEGVSHFKKINILQFVVCIIFYGIGRKKDCCDNDRYLKPRI